MVVVSAAPGNKNINCMKVGLDTWAGVNLIRQNQVPYGANIRRAPTVTKVKAVQGQKVVMVGEVTLSIKVAECPDPVDADFLVVESFVVPALLGTHWIDSYVWSIDPPSGQFCYGSWKIRSPLESPSLLHPKDYNIHFEFLPNKRYLLFQKRG
jgi:hypothetical protein